MLEGGISHPLQLTTGLVVNSFVITSPTLAGERMLLIPKISILSEQNFFCMTDEPSYGREGDRFRMMIEPSYRRERVNLPFDTRTQFNTIFIRVNRGEVCTSRWFHGC